jgi:PIN domain nuclease of toxin-antitoxin system
LRLLLDSNAFLWAYARPEELSTASRRAIADTANDRWVSIASLWEIAIKLSIGKLSLPNDSLAAAITHLAVTVMPISVLHVGRAQALPFHHRDPFDRMMIAQAMEEGLTIVTRDRHFRAYGVPILAA